MENKDGWKEQMKDYFTKDLNNASELLTLLAYTYCERFSDGFEKEQIQTLDKLNTLFTYSFEDFIIDHPGLYCFRIQSLDVVVYEHHDMEYYIDLDTYLDTFLDDYIDYLKEKHVSL